MSSSKTELFSLGYFFLLLPPPPGPLCLFVCVCVCMFFFFFWCVCVLCALFFFFFTPYRIHFVPFLLFFFFFFFFFTPYRIYLSLFFSSSFSSLPIVFILFVSYSVFLQTPMYRGEVELGCRLAYYGQIVTNAESRFSVALRPQKP